MKIVKKLGMLTHVCCAGKAFFFCEETYEFKVGMWWAWLGFLICFSIGCAACTGFSIRNEKIENKKMADALRKIKEEQGIV